MGYLGAIYKPETICPFALTSCQLLKPEFVLFWFKHINPISLVVLHDSTMVTLSSPWNPYPSKLPELDFQRLSHCPRSFVPHHY